MAATKLRVFKILHDSEFGVLFLREIELLPELSWRWGVFSLLVFTFSSLEIVSFAVVFSIDLIFILLFLTEWLETKLISLNPNSSSFFVFSLGLNFTFLKPILFLFPPGFLKYAYFFFVCLFMNYSNFFSFWIKFPLIIGSPFSFLKGAKATTSS